MNVHEQRMRLEVRKRSVAELVDLYGRLPAVRGRLTLRQRIVRGEIERRGESLRALGIVPPEGSR